MSKDYEKEAASAMIDAIRVVVNRHADEAMVGERLLAADPIRRKLGKEAVQAIMEGKAAVLPIWKGQYGTYLGEPSVWERKIGNCDFEDYRLDREQPEGGQP